MSPADFADFYSSHLHQVKAFLARRGCKRHAIDDLAQETFLRAWLGRERFSGKVAFRTWLLGIARNTAREFWRKQVDVHAIDCESSPMESPCPGLDHETKQALESAVSQLPAKQRIAISLVYLDGLSQTEAAMKTACAHDAFRQRLVSGRLRLRALLRDAQNT